MRILPLDGEWTLSHFPEGEWAVAHPDDLGAAGVDSIPARVPGNVELDLQRAGLLPDPFTGMNIHLLRPLEFEEWWYTREFDLPEDTADTAWDLVFEGLDTLATVWVNGHEAGRTDNMLIAHTLDVTRLLRPGARNTITVRLDSPLREAQRRRYDAMTLSWERREEALYIRKAPHVYGWDIMPRAVSNGIWKPVYLRERAANAIDEMYYWTAQASERQAVLGAQFNLRVADFGPNSRLCMHFTATCGDHRFEHRYPVEFVAGSARIPIDAPRLWWPRGYGAPNLYTVTARLMDGARLLAERSDRVGLRTVQVDRTEKAGIPWTPKPAGGVARVDSAAEPVAHFFVRVNGVPIQVRGTNWVPLDAFHSRDAERLDTAMALLDDIGCNMVRCWGGNVYESDTFFDKCDAMGVLVWQDFAFACCRYPQDDAFLDRVRIEAEAVVRRLRNHPSLALWCGDNEIDGCYAWDGLNPERNRISREVLPRVTHRLDPWRAHVPASPHIPSADEGRMAEQHLWGPRSYYKSAYYLLHNAHFIGEIGYHGCPNVSSVKRFIEPDYWWPHKDNPQWKLHNTYHWRHDGIDRDRIKLMANQVRELFGDIPDNLEDFALASQLVQAEAKKCFIESTRLRKWRTSGVIWWNLIDGWPQFSDAVVDYYFGRKLAYEYIRRVQTPVCVVIGESAGENHLPVVVCNDTRGNAGVAWRVWDAESGETAANGDIDVPAGENWQAARLRTYASDRRLLLIEWTVSGERFGNHYLAGGPIQSFERVRALLPLIAALPRPFDAAAVAR